MVDLRVTAHAVERFLERVDPSLTWDEARAQLSSPVIQKAANFGAPYVRLGTGQRIVIDSGSVVTVLPRDTWPASLDRRRTQIHHDAHHQH